MEQSPFFWGANGAQLTYAQAKKRREVADALATKGSAPKTFGEGLNRVGEALVAKSFGDQATAAEEAGAASRKAVIDALMSNPNAGMSDIYGALTNDWVASDPGSSAVVQALLGQKNRDADWARQDAVRADDRAYDAPLRELQLQEAQQGLDKGALEIDKLRQPDPGFRVLTPEEAASMNLPPDGAYQVGPDQKVYEIGGGGTNVNVNMGGGPKLGSLSTDYGYKLGPDGEPVIDPATGLPTAAPVPGSPAALAAAAAADKTAQVGDRKGTATDTITDAAAIARDLASQGGTTGVVGLIQGFNPESNAAELRRQTEVLTSVATIENLNQMRQSSPTGGALGNVTEGEGRMLAAAAGAIDPDAAPEQYRRALDNYEKTLLRIVHGQAEGDRIFAETRSGGSTPPDMTRYQSDAPPADWSGSPDLWKYMSPEDRALWK